MRSPSLSLLLFTLLQSATSPPSGHQLNYRPCCLPQRLSRETALAMKKRPLHRMRVYCIAIHHSFVTIKLSTLAMSFLPVSIWALHPADTH
ncbi:hypothetical protein NQZ68_031415 [Dissostichus eleginoides]|nr:hypothetical protein NQZ68_031415 [Dissostichus eleginoides]